MKVITKRQTKTYYFLQLIILLISLNACQNSYKENIKQFIITGKGFCESKIDIVSVKGVYHKFWQINKPKIIDSKHIGSEAPFEHKLGTEEAYPAKVKYRGASLDIWVKEGEKIEIMMDENGQINLSENSSIFSKILNHDALLIKKFEKEKEFSFTKHKELFAKRMNLIPSGLKNATFINYFESKVKFEYEVIKMKNLSNSNTELDSLWEYTVKDPSYLNNSAYLNFVTNYLDLKRNLTDQPLSPQIINKDFSKYYHHKKELLKDYCPPQLQETLLVSEMSNLLTQDYSLTNDTLMRNFLQQSELADGLVYFEEQFFNWRQIAIENSEIVPSAIEM